MEVKVVELMGDHQYVYLSLAGQTQPLVMKCHSHHRCKPGERIAVHCDTAPAHVFAGTDAHARSLHDLDSTSRIAELAAERRRPVRVAIVGEFNAGKSTFINALIGAEIAPTGVLPTTATLHHLRYAPDPKATIA